jgi:hypothetical protein
MTAAAFRGIALFLWSRNRRSFVTYGLIYALACSLSGALSPEQKGSLLVPLLLLLPLVAPLSLFVDSGRVANVDLTSAEGVFPRVFFVLPAAARDLVLPFVSYAVLFAAVQWTLALLVLDRGLRLTTTRLWVPFLAMSFVVWMQALMWTPARHRVVRSLQLVALLSVYIFVFVNALEGTFSSEAVIALSVVQLPIACVVAVRGVARSRRGDPSEIAGRDRNDSAISTSAARSKRGVPREASPLDAQLWMERRLHPAVGKSALLALIPAAALTSLFVALLSGAHERDPEGVELLGAATIVLLFIALGGIGLSAGASFGGFRRLTPWNQADAYSMPPYFAALPMTTGDFAWAKMRAATQRMLWVSVAVVLVCAAVAKISGFSDAWMIRHAAWRHEYGLAGTLALAALPSVSSVLLVLSATASIMWITLLGRSRAIVRSIQVAGGFLLLLMLAMVQWRGVLAHVLPVMIPVVAVVKLGALAALLLYVGSRRILSWGRLAAITLFWAVTSSTVAAWLMWYSPEGRIGLPMALSSAIAVAPVLGAVAAPAALAWNRVR